MRRRKRRRRRKREDKMQCEYSVGSNPNMFGLFEFKFGFTPNTLLTGFEI